VVTRPWARCSDRPDGQEQQTDPKRTKPFPARQGERDATPAARDRGHYGRLFQGEEAEGSNDDAALFSIESRYIVAGLFGYTSSVPLESRR
jgi:hypothetical protein